jgi:hypothetical protein
MIVPATGPLDPTTGGLHALYVSLNSPVVTVDRLPVGPASAAIAVHLVTGATLMIRSLRTGTVAFYHADPEAVGARAGLGPDAALAHAEGLGFLFEEGVTQGGAGLPKVEWPSWLSEVFQDFEDSARVDLSTWLSKFRWALADEALARDADLALEAADARDAEFAQ